MTFNNIQPQTKRENLSFLDILANGKNKNKTTEQLWLTNKSPQIGLAVSVIMASHKIPACAFP